MGSSLFRIGYLFQMFKRRTLFVIGAGASHEAELPVGAKLAESIAERLVLRDDSTGQTRPAEPDLYSQLRRAHPQAGNELVAAYKKIREGVILSNSIDDFLHVHRNDPHIVEVGKAAIVNAIVAAEAGSRPYVDHSNMYNVPDYKKVADTWYVKLMRVLGAGTSATDAPNANLIYRSFSKKWRARKETPTKSKSVDVSEFSRDTCRVGDTSS